MINNAKEGKCIIFSAPSGAGKTTIVRALLAEMNQLAFSISACSREPRGVEKDGVDYHFIGIEEFQAKILQNDFVEWEEVYSNNYYGTLKSELARIWNSGKTVVFDVDVIGGLHLKEIFKENALAIFIKPPNQDVLEDRLRKRNTETEDKIQIRIKKAKEEVLMAGKFDTIIENDILEQAIASVREQVLKFLSR
ncbi:MAG: guanylate kinase [Flavobacteriia bacterium]|nr:guanylate kinase [Flavobacteriia bacterium]